VIAKLALRGVLTDITFLCSFLGDDSDEVYSALSALPETFINSFRYVLSIASNLYLFSSFVQSFVSLRRIEKYLNGAEIIAVPPLNQQSKSVAFQSCTLRWPQDRNASSLAPSAASTPKHKFVLVGTGIKYSRNDVEHDSPAFYISVYAARVLYERLLESVLFADIRFHDTVSRGRLLNLNRFGKDFEGWLSFKSILTSIIYFSY
jgi:hypothetical protein